MLLRKSINHMIKCLVLLGFFVSLFGCSSPVETLQTSAINTPRVPTDTATPKATITNTVIPTNTKQPTLTSTVTEILPTATKTPYPTIAPEDVRDFINEAVESNLGCQLPCWLGITPGKTKWDDAQAFLEMFVTEILPLPNGSGYRAEFPYDNSPHGKIFLKIYVSEDRVVNSLRVLSLYSIPQIIDEFGVPDEIWLSSSGENYYSLPPYFTIALHYLQDGLLFFVLDGDGTYQNDVDGRLFVQICPEHTTSGTHFVYLGQLGTTTPFEQLKGYISPDPEINFQPLEKTTNMDIDTFVEAFTSEENGQCILTPADIWPFPLTPEP